MCKNLLWTQMGKKRYLHNKIHLHLFPQKLWWRPQHRKSIQPVRMKKQNIWSLLISLCHGRLCKNITSIWWELGSVWIASSKLMCSITLMDISVNWTGVTENICWDYWREGGGTPGTSLLWHPRGRTNKPNGCRTVCGVCTAWRRQVDTKTTVRRGDASSGIVERFCFSDRPGLRAVNASISFWRQHLRKENTHRAYSNASSSPSLTSSSSLWPSHCVGGMGVPIERWE